MQHLQSNSTLQGGKYKIEKVLGQGGFGITYLAENTMLDGKVAIKEFFFKEYCDRDEATSHVTIGTSGNRDIVERFKMKFIKEARTIFKLNHPNIVRILDIFEENNTAYYVMDFIEGESLSDMVKHRGFIPEAEAIGYIKNVADALSYIHSKNMNHLDIKPGNIMKRKEDGQIFVIDFGVAKQYDSTTSEGTTTTPVGISKGYSPNEQYMLGGVQSFSPQSDVYALAATLFKLLTGTTPPESMLVQDEGLPTEELKAKNISQSVIKALDAAMQSKRKRTQSIAEFISNLNCSVSATNSDDEATLFTPEMQRAEEERKRKEAEAKAAKERAEVETRTKAEAERKVSEKEDTKMSKKNASKMWLWTAISVVVISAVSGISYLQFGALGSSKTFSVNVAPLDSTKTFTVNGVPFDMIKVSSGTFTMGSEVEGLDSEDQKPIHLVTLSDYYIGCTEVTQELWMSVMEFNPSKFKGKDKPVECITWNDCQIFIKKLNQITGMKFRLPTEAEWEFAARGGKNGNSTRYSGSDTINNVAWYNYNEGYKTHPVATLQANELGIYDMSGNVWEWCSDWYGSYDSELQINPSGPASGTYRVNRGGSFYHLDDYCHPYHRSYQDPDYCHSTIGLRLALSE